MTEQTNPPPSRTFQEIVADWQKRLLQLDRGNGLLYFKAGRTSSGKFRTPVQIAEHSPDSIYEATSRFTDRDQFVADLKTLGFGQISIEDEWKFTHIIASKDRLNPRRPVERLGGL